MRQPTTAALIEASRSAPAPGAHGHGISSTVPDWSRERCRRWWDPPRQLLSSIRSYHRWQRRGGLVAAVGSIACVLRYRFWSAVSGTDIPLNCRLGGGLNLPHPNGVVIHPDATIGVNCTIFQQVTIGFGGPRPGLPTIGGHVDIGAGAKILGGVTIGDHARIGANAVVLDDVPAGASAVGIPARIVAPRRDGAPSARRPPDAA